MTTSGKISKNNQFQNTQAGFTIFSVHSQHLKSSSSAFRPALSNLWLLLVYMLFMSKLCMSSIVSKKSITYFFSQVCSLGNETQTSANSHLEKTNGKVLAIHRSHLEPNSTRYTFCTKNIMKTHFIAYRCIFLPAWDKF